MTYREKGDYDRALADFEKIQEVWPEDHLARISSYALKADYEKSLDAFDRTLAMRFASTGQLLPEAYIERGWTYARIGYTELAKRDFAKAKKLAKAMKIEHGYWFPSLPPIDPDAQKN